MRGPSSGILSFGMAAGLALGGEVLAQSADGTRREFIQRKLAAIEQFASANQAKLRRYTWTETVRYLLNGELRSTRRFLCRYGPDGSIERTPAGGPVPAAESKDGPFRPSAREATPEDLDAYLAKVRTAVGLYVPPDIGRMQQAFQAGRVRVDRRAQGEALLDFQSYAKPGDAMLLDFRTDAKRLESLKVETYLGDPSEPIALDVRFAALPDGTNTPGDVEVSASAKAVRIMITNGDYRPAP